MINASELGVTYTNPIGKEINKSLFFVPQFQKLKYQKQYKLLK